MLPIERFKLDPSQMVNRWYNAVPDLPRAPLPLLDPRHDEPVSTAYLERMYPAPLVAQETSLERWIDIPNTVLDAYRMWRPTPLVRARGLERYLETPARIYFKYEGGSPTGSHKLNSALAQVHLAKIAGIRRLVTDTGAGQWGSALALAGSLLGLDVVVYMVRASYYQKPYRRAMMETYGARVLPSPSPATEFGRSVLAKDPDHPGSEGIAVTESIEAVEGDAESRLAIGGFGNAVLLHQTVIGLEAQQQLEALGESPDFLVASVGCGSNLGGLALPWLREKWNRHDLHIVAAEPEACPSLTRGKYEYDFADSGRKGVRGCTYTLGHEFVPPPIHAGGLRYHGCAPLIGLLRNEGVIEARSFHQKRIFEAGILFARLHGFVPAPETCHAISAAIDIALECKSEQRDAVILFGFSGHGLLDLSAYAEHQAGEFASPLGGPQPGAQWRRVSLRREDQGLPDMNPLPEKFPRA
jgi:tryptophan synthase beta chain